MGALKFRKPIGPGRPGAKTRGLKRHSAKFKRGRGYGLQDKLILSDLVAITPELMAAFLKRNGISHEDPSAARKALREVEFSPTEKEAFREALAVFEDEMLIAVRSDEATAKGTGFWHTELMLVDSGLERVEEIARRILISEFNEGTIAFKRKVGIAFEDVPGVLVMPFSGVSMREKGEFVHTTPYHVTLLTNFKGDKTFALIGVGIGGSNNFRAICTLLETFNPTRMYSGDLEDRLKLNARGKSGSHGMLWFEDGKLVTDPRLIRPYHSSSFSGFDDLRSSIAPFAPNGSTYLEVGLTASGWEVLQCEDYDFPDVQKPDLPDSSNVMDLPDHGSFEYGLCTVGRGVVQDDNIIFLDRANISDLEGWNESLEEGYILVLNGTYSDLRDLDFSTYCNAKAIVVNYSDRLKFGLNSHFKGVFRDSGILVLGGHLDRKLTGSLNPGYNYKDITVYVNDAKEEGAVYV